MKLYDAAGMREADRRAIEELGIPGPVLMENAARGAFLCLVDTFNDALVGGVTVLAGRGNNGGDGHVIARYLHNIGVAVTLVCLFKPGEARGDAALNLEIARRCGVPLRYVPDADRWQAEAAGLLDVGLVVDALLGTGLSADVTGLYHQVIVDVNASGCAVLAVDVPSGVDASTGRVFGVAVEADLTVTFGGMKLGLAVTPASGWAGQVKLVDIGLPPLALAGLEAGTLLDRVFVAEHLPGRPPAGHKGTFGHVLVVAGSRGKLGAGILSASAALRAGAGLVTLATPRGALDLPQMLPPEIMVEALPDGGSGLLGVEALPRLTQLAQGKDAVVVGPGIGQGDGVRRVVEATLACDLPTVVDADGLNALAAGLHGVGLHARCVLTPHPGEMARLLGLSTADVQDDRLGAARRLAEATGAVVVLKGAGTIVHAGEAVWVNGSGNVGLATAGTGDVLTGIVAALLAEGMAAPTAAACAVFLHGRAGDLAAEALGPRAMVASDVLEHLGAAFKALEGP